LCPCADGTGTFYLGKVNVQVGRWYFRRYREMATEKKVQIVESLQEVFSKCNIGILTDYRGLSTAEMSDLRRRLREVGVEYRVVKNSLAQFAAKQAGMDELADSFSGPVAVALGYGEIADAPRVLADYIRATKSTLEIKGGFLGYRLMTSGDVDTLATLPAREVLISQVMAGIQSPIVGLVSVLVAPIRGIMGVLQARIQQLEGA
jgi:large subunit ribosomal protein L10